MATDTKGLSRELEGKVLRVYFKDGVVDEIRLVAFELHENCQFGDEYRGIIYDLIHTNRPDVYMKDPKSCSFWAELDDIERIEVIPDEILCNPLLNTQES